MKRLKDHQIHIFSFTNQPGISQELSNIDDFYTELMSFGFDGVYLCPHGHDEGCVCRKPEPGMLEKAAKEHCLNLENCVVIGDRWSDMVAASKVCAIRILVKTGAGESSLTDQRSNWQAIEPDYVAETLEDAVEWLMKDDID